jgi:hypothetical protein
VSGNRKVESREFGDSKVTSVELDFMSAADLLPDLLSVIAPAYNADDTGEALARMATALMGGKFVSLLPRLLKGTTVVVQDEGKGMKVDLVDASAINRAFTGRKKLAIDVIRLAIEVNFADFFAEADLAAALGMHKVP